MQETTSSSNDLLNEIEDSMRMENTKMSNAIIALDQGVSQVLCVKVPHEKGSTISTIRLAMVSSLEND